MPLRGALLLVVQIAGLIGTAVIVWFSSIAPRVRFGFGSPASIVTDALEYALLAWAWSAAVVLFLCLAVEGDPRNAARLVLRVSRTAVWLAPASILLSQGSPAAILPALALIIGATEMFYAQWASTRPQRRATQPLARRQRFELLQVPPFRKTYGPALIAGLALQTGLAAFVLHRAIMAGFLFSGAAAILTLLMLRGGLLESQRPASLPRAALGVVLTVILAAGLTTVHILYHRMGSVSAAGEPASDDNGRADDKAPKDKAVKLYDGPGAVEIADNVFPGVILWPEVKPYVTLITPPPSWLSTSIASQNAQPYSIPFSGEYWMFKPPQSRPPRGAYSRPGTPLTLFYRTTDHSRMAMEAHQRLDHPLDIGCCRAIRLAISNADRFPGTVSVELILIDSHRRHVALSLGTDRVTAWPRAGAPASEILEFRIPASPPVRQFDEFQIVLHRDPVRTDKSARLAIERFILVPAI